VAAAAAGGVGFGPPVPRRELTAAGPRRRELPQVALAAPPPFRLPAEHFAAALAWLLVAAILLPWLAPRLAEGRVLDPAVFALVHIIVLGVISSAIFGSLLQFVPGGLEVPLKSVRLGHAGFWLLQAGTVALVAGFWWWRGWLQLTGWLLIFGAAGAVSVNVLSARRRSIHGKLVGLYLSVAHSALGAGMALALARIGETLGWWRLDRLGAIAAHVALGVIGFGTLTVVGVGSRMVPTFLLAHGDDRRKLHLILTLATAGLIVFPVGALGGWSLVSRIGAVLLGASVLTILELGWRWFRRGNRDLDPSLRHVAMAFVGLAVTLAWGVALGLTDPGDLPRWGAFVAAALLGWLVMMVVGVMAKIVSHLSYQHLFRTMPGFARAGNPNRLLRADWMLASWGLLSAGSLTLPVALDQGHGPSAAGAAAIWSTGVVMTVANYVRMFLRGRQP
jgi:hypothetical protein